MAVDEFGDDLTLRLGERHLFLPIDAERNDRPDLVGVLRPDLERPRQKAVLLHRVVVHLLLVGARLING